MIEDDFEVIVKDIVKNITSSTISESRKILLITTAKGFVLCDLLKSRYIRYNSIEIGLKIRIRHSTSNRRKQSTLVDLG
jgi:hypothetical protein